jgi:hypothetical protein
MTEEKRVKNVINISDTLWQLNRFTVISQIEKLCGSPVPDDCLELIECSFRFGAVLMEKALGKRAKRT